MDVTSGLGYPRKTRGKPQNRIRRLAGLIHRFPRSHLANTTGTTCRNPREKRDSRKDRRSADILAIIRLPEMMCAASRGRLAHLAWGTAAPAVHKIPGKSISSSEQRFRYIPLQRIPGIPGVNEAVPRPICYVTTPAWASRLAGRATAPTSTPAARVATRSARPGHTSRGVSQGLRIIIAKLGYMGSFVSRANPDFCRTVLRLSDSVVTNTAHCYLRNII